MSVQLITANHASGQAAAMAGRANRFARGFGSGIYPITPQTECVELLSSLDIEKGHVVKVESEHSAMAVCMGFSLSGARSFTASSSNGLAYMVENVYAAAFFRLPIVMMAVNRTLGPPWNIWADHGDTLALRDAGWIQFYCEDNQEVFDTTLLAYRLGEDARVLLPVLVCQDSFVLSHTLMETDVPDQDTVDAFLPTLDLPHRVTDRPRTFGGLDFPHETEVHRRQFADAMDRVLGVYAEVQDAFEGAFGRRPADPVVPYRMEDAEVVVISMGTIGATARRAVDLLRDQGIRAGALRVRMFRPFPADPLRKLLAGARHIAVIDRNLSPGLGGVLWSELKTFYDGDAVVQDYMMGLGGGDVRPEHLVQVVEDVTRRDQASTPQILEVA
jgi:pyruvate/2-oxoacid:ferredoxin oxidoreductase alpha subunit